MDFTQNGFYVTAGGWKAQVVKAIEERLMVIHYLLPEMPTECQELRIHYADGSARIQDRHSHEFNLVGEWAEPFFVESDIYVVMGGEGETFMSMSPPMLPDQKLLASFPLRWNSRKPLNLAVSIEGQA
jgi:hypothetical protein